MKKMTVFLAFYQVLYKLSTVFLYPSIEERATHLAYFAIKNHPFSDGNKLSVHFYLCGF
ncbi:Fic family protein [Arachidicoccus sp.]|uniref:Fic family protein n=1 Tax=Arachidicoccus sp. TaxID=1872624 RepID=UPI003D21E55B